MFNVQQGPYVHCTVCSDTKKKYYKNRSQNQPLRERPSQGIFLCLKMHIHVSPYWFIEQSSSVVRVFRLYVSFPMLGTCIVQTNTFTCLLDHPSSLAKAHKVFRIHRPLQLSSKSTHMAMNIHSQAMNIHRPDLSC